MHSIQLNDCLIVYCIYKKHCTLYLNNARYSVIIQSVKGKENSKDGEKVFELSQDELDVIATHMDDGIRERCF